MDNKLYDLIIIGCGPAGLSAAINARIREKDFLIFGGDNCLTKVRRAPRVDNYLGFSNIKGEDLCDQFTQHANDLNISITDKRVDAIYPLENKLQITIKNENYETKAVILSTGLSEPKYLPGEKDLLGKGVGYCATCDGPLYKGKRVIIVGEVHEAEEDANFLADLCENVLYISTYGAPAKLKDNIKVVEETPKNIYGKEHFEKIDTNKGTYEADGLFIIREVTPIQDMLPGLKFTDKFIEVNKLMATNISGVFAAGDCTGPPYQLAKATGEGLVAALEAVKYIDNM